MGTEDAAEAAQERAQGAPEKGSESDPEADMTIAESAPGSVKNSAESAGKGPEKGSEAGREDVSGEPGHVREAIELIRAFEGAALKRHPEGYVVGYSGGKDSDVLVDLFLRSGVRFQVLHNLTTMDAPETVRHIRRNFARWRAMGIRCIESRPEQDFWTLSVSARALPTRWRRFCCTRLKETGPRELKHATHAFGVRRAESAKRKERDSIEMSNNKKKPGVRFRYDNAGDVLQSGACYAKKYFFLNPMAYWTDRDVWEYTEARGIETNPLYAEGFTRIGCVGCPLASARTRLSEFERWPAYFCRTYRAAEEIVRLRKEEGRPMHHRTAEELMRDWCEAGRLSISETERLERLLGVAKAQSERLSRLRGHAAPEGAPEADPELSGEEEEEDVRDVLL